MRPVCGACSIRLDDCVFPDPVIARDPVRRRTASHPSARKPQGLQIRPLVFNASLSQPTHPPISNHSLNMFDLKLLHHYILHTSKRMTLHPEKSLVWERIIPDIASDAEYLMHLLLALAGLDVLRTHSNAFYQTKHDGSLIKIVIRHHQEGLKGLQQELQTIGDSNLEDLLTGATLVNAFAFASLCVGELNHPVEDPPHYPEIEQIPQNVSNNPERPQVQWLSLIGSSFSIIKPSWMQLQRTRLRSLLVFKKANEDWKHFKSELTAPIELPSGMLSATLSAFASNAFQAICDLRAFSNGLKFAHASPSDENDSLSFQSSCVDPSTDQDKAIEVLETMYMRILHVLCLPRTGAQPSSELEIQIEIEDAAIASWPTLLSEGFISSLDSNSVHRSVQSLSLTILAHLYLTLALLDKIWYFGRTFDLEIKKTAAFINQSADIKLMELMKWPIYVIEQ